MSQRIKAIFHGGVFEPSQSVKLRDGAEVDVILPSEENLPSPQSAARILKEISKLARNESNGAFSGEQHDQELYK